MDKYDYRIINKNREDNINFAHQEVLRLISYIENRIDKLEASLAGMIGIGIVFLRTANNIPDNNVLLAFLEILAYLLIGLSSLIALFGLTFPREVSIYDPSSMFYEASRKSHNDKHFSEKTSKLNRHLAKDLLSNKMEQIVELKYTIDKLEKRARQCRLFLNISVTSLLLGVGIFFVKNFFLK